MKARHGRCGKTWTQRGNATSHCAACHETFANLTLFDTHRAGDHTARHCLPPAPGLIQDDEGVWWTPEGHANLHRLAERFATQRAQAAELARVP